MTPSERANKQMNNDSAIEYTDTTDLDS